jgi:hypothetical protein
VTAAPEPTPRPAGRSAHDEAAALPGTLSPTAHDEPAQPLRSAEKVRALTFGTVAWLVVLAAVTGVQLSRRAWPDAITLATVLGLLVVDLTGRLRHGTVAVANTGPAIIGAAVLVALILFVAPRHGAVAGLAVVATGAAALAYAWPDRAGATGDVGDRPVWDRPTSRTAFAWSAAWIAACLWELTMFILGSKETDGRNRYPAASDILDPLLNHPLAKAVFVVVWLAAGVGLLARADRR